LSHEPLSVLGPVGIRVNAVGFQPFPDSCNYFGSQWSELHRAVSGCCSDQELAAEVSFEAVDLFEQTRLVGAEGFGGGSQRGVVGGYGEALQSVPAERIGQRRTKNRELGGYCVRSAEARIAASPSSFLTSLTSSSTV
jgi:hypothetical protein